MSKTTITTEQAIGLLRTRVTEAGEYTIAARKLGISAQYLHDILAGRKKPGPKAIAALGYTAEAQRFRKVTP